MVSRWRGRCGEPDSRFVSQSKQFTDVVVVEPPLPEAPDSLTSGDVLRSVVQLAAPNVATLLLTSFNLLCDAFFVGGLGKTELAASGMARTLIMFLMVFTVAVTSGTTALVARFTGARDEGNAMLAAQQSVRLTLWLSVAVGVPLWLFRGWLLSALGADDQAVQLGSAYLAIAFATTPAMFLNLTLTAVFRGVGLMKTPMFALMAMDIVNILLAYLLIRPFGLVGAASASGVARLIPTVWLLVAMRQSPMLAPALRGNWLQTDREWALRILRIGAPQIIGNLAFNVGRGGTYFLMNNMPDATAAIAAFTFGVTVEGLSFMPGFAFHIATATLVGQNLGARQPGRAHRCARKAMWLGVTIMSLMGVVLFVGATPIARLSGPDPLVRAMCADYLRIGAICQPLLGAAMVLWGALLGAGDTKFAAIVSILTNCVLRLIPIWLFGIVLGHGVVAVWWVLSLSWFVSIALLEARFRSGAWMRVQV